MFYVFSHFQSLNYVPMIFNDICFDSKFIMIRFQPGDLIQNNKTAGKI